MCAFIQKCGLFVEAIKQMLNFIIWLCSMSHHHHHHCLFVLDVQISNSCNLIMEFSFSVPSLEANRYVVFNKSCLHAMVPISNFYARIARYSSKTAEFDWCNLETSASKNET